MRACLITNKVIILQLASFTITKMILLLIFSVLLFQNDKKRYLSDIPVEVVYVTIGNPAFCLALYLSGVHFRGELQHIGDVSE